MPQKHSSKTPNALTGDTKYPLDKNQTNKQKPNWKYFKSA